MAQVSLQPAGVVPFIGQREAASVAKHVGMHLDVQTSGYRSSLHHSRKTCRREWSTPLRDEYKR
jgi:hypothetical protein